MVKIPTSIAVSNFPKMQFMGKFLSICTTSDLSVDQSGSPPVILSLSAEILFKFLSNFGEKHAVNYLHEIPVKLPTVHTSSVTSVIAPICGLPIPSIHLSDDEYQEIPD